MRKTSIGRPTFKNNGRVALVLGGGAARGFAHIGVLEVLEAEGIPIDMIVGTSVGAIFGSLYAAGLGVKKIRDLAFRFKTRDILDIAPLGRLGLIDLKGLQRLLTQNLPATFFSELRIPLHVIATDLRTGEAVTISRGPIVEAVCASSALPGVFDPWTVDGRLLTDGGVVANLPVREAHMLGASTVIAVDIGAAVEGSALKDRWDIIFQVMHIYQAKASAEDIERAEVLIRPDVGHFRVIDLEHRKEIYQEGLAAGRESLNEIRRVLDTRGWLRGLFRRPPSLRNGW